MTLPLAVSPKQATSIAATFIETCRDFLQARERERRNVYEELAVKHYTAFRTVHGNFHGVLSPMKRRLSDLESAVAFGGNALPDALEAMDQELNLLEKLREEGQPARRELYERCKVIAGSMILSKRNAKPLDEAERRLIRQLMIAICKYFELRGRYEHDFGGAIGALSARVAAWKSGNIRLTVANVRETREVLAKVMQRMSDDWGEISSHFLYIQTSVELNLNIKQALKLAQTHDNVPLEHVELWGAVA